MQPLPPQLEIPKGERFTLPTVSAVREVVPPGGQLPAHMVLKMICGKELWVPLDKEIAWQMANILLHSVNDSRSVLVFRRVNQTGHLELPTSQKCQ